ncbi:FAD-binding oxidoreductase [Altererythrobacter arenosus]|uniref:FAD-binding oxidoreductase n=1 Tax=Altererythrobacter arenosus TaxID=3032592 RepID=A0ABY8G1Z1_9SPHN|nr:FAD-binding oxidoreductase [Altererythrobacter sp. CAU 1644]WFL78964.1 FAD-binding oxidoreductase [Altererythrobacter sp. CAU 1644]
MKDELLSQFRAVCGESGVICGEDLATRAGDWLGQSSCGAVAIVRPRSTDELSQVLRLCHANDQPVVGAGGLTGLVHGTDATGEQVQISFERMRSVITVDPVGRTMAVEAGVPLQLAQEEAQKHGLIYAVDLGARGSATIGGTISTNAGGNQVIRYGMTRENILGLEAVLADGTVVSSMNTLLKNNAAYDLKQLFIGTEGTLGLVTKAVLRLHPKPLTTSTALLGVESFEDVMTLFGKVSGKLGPMLTSFEVMWRSHYRTVAVESGRHSPPLSGDYGFYVVVEASGMDPERDWEFFTELIAALLEEELVADAVIASSDTQRKAIWNIREDVEGLLHVVSPVAIFDVSLPIAAMDRYIGDLEAAVAGEWGDEARVVTFGHLGDSNLHIGVAPRPWSEEARHRVEELVYSPLAEFGGSISAEHGIGLEKRDWLHVTRNPQEIELMRLLKATLDPKGLLNPGKVLAKRSD